MQPDARERTALNKRLQPIGLVLATCLAALAGTVAYSAHRTERDIAAFEARVAALAQTQPAPTWDTAPPRPVR